jgi:hypothetical protein
MIDAKRKNAVISNLKDAFRLRGEAMKQYKKKYSLIKKSLELMKGNRALWAEISQLELEISRLKARKGRFCSVM